MSLWKLVRIDFGGNPVHFGELGIGMEETSERVHSDTLFSAWVSIYARLYSEEIEDLFRRFPQAGSTNILEPPFRLSSTFLYGKTSPDSYIYYLPSLLKLPAGYPHDNLKFAKDFRKLKYLPLSVWRRWYQQEGILDSDIPEIEYKNGKLAHQGTFEYGKFFQKQTLPKVAIDRIHAATNFYQTSFVYFRDGGLYFIFYMPESDAELFDRLQIALSFLGDEGIGGERSSGAGRFTAEWLDLPTEFQSLVDPPDISTNFYALISLFWDDIDACLACIEDENTLYQIQERRGWISARSGRQLRRKSVAMFMEGSIFSQLPSGKLAIVTPEKLTNKHHPIYRSGISLSIPVKP
jgi:CRISPR-associated protein Csm4